MSELPPEVTELLSRARAGQLRADPAVRARVRRALHAGRAAGARASSAAQPGAAGARAWQARSWPTPSLKALVTAGAGAGLVAAALLVRLDVPSAARTVEPAHVRGAPPALSAGASTRSEARAAGAEPPFQSADEAISRAQPAADDLVRELAALKHAEEALQAGDPARALVLLGDAARVGQGQLAEEREALALLARCELGHAPEQEVRAFLRRVPQSLLRARLLGACARKAPR